MSHNQTTNLGLSLIRDDDNFGAIRLLAAVTVIFGHSFPLSGLSSPVVQGNEVQSLAVKVFFVVSGYLITQSWLTDPLLAFISWHFIERRVMMLKPQRLASPLPHPMPPNKKSLFASFSSEKEVLPYK